MNSTGGSSSFLIKNNWFDIYQHLFCRRGSKSCSFQCDAQSGVILEQWLLGTVVTCVPRHENGACSNTHLHNANSFSSVIWCNWQLSTTRNHRQVMKRKGLMQPQVVLLIIFHKNQTPPQACLWAAGASMLAAQNRATGPQSETIFGFVCPCSPHWAFAAAANINNNPVKMSDAKILPNKTAPNIQGDENALRWEPHILPYLQMWVAWGKLGHTGVSAEPTRHRGDPERTVREHRTCV